MLNTMPMLGRFPRSVWIFRSLWIFAVAVLVASAGLLAYGAYLATFLELPRSEDHPPLRLYTAPFPLKTGLSLKTARLPERLQRLGYRPVNDAVVSPGDYRLTASAALRIGRIGLGRVSRQRYFAPQHVCAAAARRSAVG